MNLVVIAFSSLQVDQLSKEIKNGRNIQCFFFHDITSGIFCVGVDSGLAKNTKIILFLKKAILIFIQMFALTKNFESMIPHFYVMYDSK